MANFMWTQGMSKEEKEDFTRVLSLEINSRVWTRLKEVINTKKTSLEVSERSTELYDNPNWAFQQAHNNGAIQMLVLINKLLEG